MKTDTIPLDRHDSEYCLLISVKEENEKFNTQSPARSSRFVAAAITLFAICYLLWSTFFTPHQLRDEWYGSFDLSEHVKPPSGDKRLVPLEAHIMSKCPDARDCLKMMVLPTMQKVADKVNFTLSYIGTPTANGGVECKHGPGECMGNIIELCSAKLYPDPKIYLGFTMCLTRDFDEIPQPDLVKDCALEHGIEFEKLHECATTDDGGLGMNMLRSSVRRSTQDGVTKSCTVRLDEKIYCVRDGNQWKECPNGPVVTDLVDAIEKLFQSS
ncbi:hypothetical protein K3495_g9049 [Podosphaera aphanis]|nr:hypothetical protein K3495_g9049 [Podosphaera aphanis]